MSFLEQLKIQASAVKSRQDEQQIHQDASTLATEQACRTVLYYLEEMVRQPNVIEAGGPAAQLPTSVLDELAKMVCGQPSRFA